MKKLLFILLLIMAIPIYADTFQDLIDKAIRAYEDKDIGNTITLLEKATNQLKTEQLAGKTDDIETVEFARLRNFPSRYEGKKIKLLDTAISSSVRKKFGKDYRITVSSINQASSFFSDPYEDGSLFFVISEPLLEKLMDRVSAGYVGYFNVYTDEIYSYVEKREYFPDKTYYVAKIISLQVVEYNEFYNTTTYREIYLTE